MEEQRQERWRFIQHPDMPVKNNTEKGEVNMREHGAVYIPDDEYLERVKRAAKIFQASGRYLKDAVLRFLRQEMRH